MQRIEHNYYKNGGGVYHMDVMDIYFHIEQKLVKSIELINEVETEIETLTDFEVIDAVNKISILLNPTEPANIEENMEWESHKLIIEALGEDATKISKYAQHLTTSTDFNIDNILNAINS